MKKTVGTIGLTAALAVLVAGGAMAAQAPIALGTAGSYAVLAGSTITNTGPTTITGNVGLQPGTAVTGFTSVTLNGSLHLADGAALQAKSDLLTAYNDAAGRTPVTTVATELGGQILTAGVYSAASGTLGLTGTLTLNGEGNPNAVFVFQSASTLISASGSRVALLNGAQACNVFWQIGSSATLGTSSSFKGTILALTSIALTTGATLEGRALARNGAVTLDTNVITTPACSTTPASSGSPSVSPSATPTASPSTSPSASATASATASPTASPSTSASPSPVPTPSVAPATSTPTSPSAGGAGVTAPATTTSAPGQDASGAPIPPFVLLLTAVAAVGFLTAPRWAVRRRRR